MRVFNRLRAGRSQISQHGRPATVMRRLGRPAAVLAGGPILILGLAAGTAAAASGGGQISPYSCAGVNEPFGITAGPNGQQALWFTNAGGEPSSPGGSIGEITTAGQCSNFGSSLINDPTGITAGPDGALWFTNFGSGTGDSIGEITTSGEVTAYTGAGIDGPEGITVGPDVNGQETLWFTNTGDGYGSIGEITFTASGQVQVYNYPGTSANRIDDPTSITAGPDGSGGQALWFANGDNSIGEITTAGTVYNYSLNQATSGVSSPYGITAGPNGTVWFTFAAGGENSTGGIGELTPTGLGQAQISYPSSDPSILNPHGITAGPDGALWFANNGNGTGTTIGRITTSPTTVNSYSGPGVDGPESITPAPDGAQALWFTNYSGNSIGEITTPAPQTITFTSRPPSPAVYGGSYTPVAAGGSGQPVTFTVDPASTAGACKINSSGMASFTGVGTCIIDANQAGNADWLPAPQVQQSFTIGQAAQTVTFTSTPPASPAFGSSYPVSATGGGSGNPVTFVIDAEGLGPCVISGSTVTFIGAGSCVIGAGQAGNADYQAATAQQVITVPQEAPVLTWGQPANIDYPVPLSGTQLDATASVAGTFTYSPPAGTVLGIGAHTLTATFTPANTTNYTSATVSTQITVVKFQPPPCPTCHK